MFWIELRSAQRMACGAVSVTGRQVSGLRQRTASSMFEAASFVIEGEPDWSTSGLCGEGHSAGFRMSSSSSVSAFPHTGSVSIILAPSIRLHGERWDDVPVSHICTMTNQTQALLHRGLLPVFPSGLVILRLF